MPGPACRYYNSQKGFYKGVYCHFSHESPEQGPKPRPQKSKTTDWESVPPSACRYFWSTGLCPYHEINVCRFLHIENPALRGNSGPKRGVPLADANIPSVATSSKLSAQPTSTPKKVAEVSAPASVPPAAVKKPRPVFGPQSPPESVLHDQRLDEDQRPPPLHPSVKKELSSKARERGNALFKVKNYPAAIRAYTEAIGK